MFGVSKNVPIVFEIVTRQCIKVRCGYKHCPALAANHIKLLQFIIGIFDVIVSIEVIEHINTPRRELAAFEIILRQGGIVYVTTPNFNSISRDMAGSRWNIIEYPEHLCYYTKHSLEKLFREANFSLLNISTTGISLNRLKKHFYGSTLQSANSDEVVRMKIEQNLILGVLKRAVNVLLSFFGKGDAIKASFQKS